MLNNQLFVGGGNTRKPLLSVSKWNCIISLFLIFGLTSCYKEDIENLQNQINQLKGYEIASIDTQIISINASIKDLKSVDQTLKDYIDALKQDGQKYEQQITALSEMDGKLDKRITDLQTYTDTQLKDTKDWANATFATMDQFDSLCTVVADVDAKVGAITSSLDTLKKNIVAGYEKAIKDAMSTLETSMKKWVNEQLADYYTIAQVDATLDSLAAAHDDADAKINKRIDEQKEALDKAKTDLTDAYKKAIEDAITDNNGKINDKIAEDIAKAKDDLQDQIDSVNEEITSIKNRLTLVEGKIATIDSQIDSIKATIIDLKSVDQTLGEYIEALKQDGKKYEQQISDLTDMDDKLDKRITELQEYTDTQLSGTKDWADATFATLVQFDSLCTVVAGIDAKVGAITSSLDTLKKDIVAGYEKAIKDAVSNVETSMKKWVNEQLADYYTIAQMDATLDSLAAAHDDADAKLDKRIDEQKEALETAKADITDAYKKAIEEAINDYDGKICDKIAEDIADAKKDLQDQIDDVNQEITSIKARLSLIEADIEALLDQIQSLVVIPQDVDGSVNVDSDGYSNISFDIKPVDVAKKLAEVWVGLSAEEKAALMTFKIKEISAQGTEVPADTIKTVAFEEDEFKIGVKFANLSDKALASLQIVYGQSDVASEYFTLYPASKPKNYVSPTSIAVLAVNPIYLTTGTQASIEFRVNPSNATFDMSGDDCQLVLDKVGTVQTKSSYVTTPSNYKLAKIEYVFDGETEELKVGQYRAIIEDTEKSAEYDEMAALVLNVKDANGDDVQISSSAFEVIGKNFENLPKTGLPIVIINTPNSETIDSKDVWKDGTTMTIINSDMTYDYQGTMGIKGRGNTTWGYPKKPYALKLDSKSKILGMPKHKRWCLLANWMDRTMIRNAVSFEIARKCPGLEWTPSGEFVEVVLNGSHVGNYYLCEQIKVDKNRVNIAELDISVTEGDGITGGFIMELDTYYDEVYKFRSSTKDLPWMFKDPDEVNDAQFNYMQNYVNEMENALYDDEKFAAREFTKYMDLESFVDWWFVYELAMNWEPNHPKSTYMNKDKNGVIKAGPVWDFDYGTFTPGGVSSFYIQNALYYEKLFSDTDFITIVKTKWESQKTDFSTMESFIESLANQLCSSDEINHAMWPITSTVNGDESMTYSEAIERMKSSYMQKLEWMNGQISQW